MSSSVRAVGFAPPAAFVSSKSSGKDISLLEFQSKLQHRVTVSAYDTGLHVSKMSGCM